MVLLDNNVFLSELTNMFHKSRAKSSVTLTMKKYDGRTKPQARSKQKAASETKEFYCLVRAVYKTKKISTIISQNDINKFQSAYCSLLRGNLDGLKKLKKPKSKPKAL